MILAGVARQVWSDNVDSSMNTYGNQVPVQARGDRFQLKDKAETYKAEFRGWCGKEDEYFIVLGYVLGRLATRAYPKTAHEACEEMVFDRFLMGLDEMGKHVSSARMAGVNQAIRLAT